MKKINHLISALIMAAMTAGFASCSSSDEPSSVSDNTPKELTITIKTQGVTTKSAANSDPVTTNENTMNRITIGIFDTSGKVRTIQEFGYGTTSGTDGIAGSTNFYYDSSSKAATATVVTTQMVNTDKVVAVVNAPASHFAGVTTLSDFKAKSITADQALHTTSTGAGSGTAINNNIPMYGETSGTLTNSGTNFNVSIQVKHLTAKVSLENLTVNFATDGPYSQASFEPTEIYLYNVPDGLKFDISDPYTNSTWLTGKSDDASPKNYLSTGTLSGDILTGNSDPGNKFDTQYYFYTTPNKDVSTNKTKLVIKGTFKNNNSDGGTTIYYPVKLNSNVDATGNHSAVHDTEYQIYPNKHYKCTVTIQSKGTTDPTADVDPTTATIRIEVVDFEGVSQTTII